MIESNAATGFAAALADRYRVERELGAGGMATVYLAEDLRHHRRVALKVLRPELAAVIGAERFLHEITTTANLQHPHILALFDSGQVDGTVFYVMPYVEGESLRERLTREKQLPINEALQITREVASALDYAHRHGVIHRDIKPENVLLHDGQALVADFGIALAASTAGGTRLTETGLSLGTPHYMSPEQAMGERQLDARTDVYALGCVLYEMLAGEPPFTGPTPQAIVGEGDDRPASTADPAPQDGAGARGRGGANGAAEAPGRSVRQHRRLLRGIGWSDGTTARGTESSSNRVSRSRSSCVAWDPRGRDGRVLAGRSSPGRTRRRVGFLWPGYPSHLGARTRSPSGDFSRRPVRGLRRRDLR